MSIGEVVESSGNAIQIARTVRLWGFFAKITGSGTVYSCRFLQRREIEPKDAAARYYEILSHPQERSPDFGGKNSSVGNSMRLNSSQGVSPEVTHSFSGIQKS